MVKQTLTCMTITPALRNPNQRNKTHDREAMKGHGLLGARAGQGYLCGRCVADLSASEKTGEGEICNQA
jgi:hypothetical protein